MRRGATFLFWFLLIRIPAGAGVAPVEVSLPETTAWTGERVRMILKIRAPGSFTGSAHFDLPELPGTLFLKTGNPVVGLEQIEGRDWFVQTHSFSLFSQRTGKLEVPSFAVRFEAREGFTGEATGRFVETEPFQVELRRPPGSEEIPFLVTSEDLAVSQGWEPAALEEKCEVGQVIRRTITQKSSGLTGMVLLPATRDAPEGIRVYEPEVKTSDQTGRGEFNGQRIETLTYLVQAPGTLLLPDLTFTWWDPKKEQLVSKTLPGRVLEVLAPTGELPAANDAVNPGRPIGWVLMALVFPLGWCYRARLLRIGRRVGRCLRPPEKSAARALKRACLRNDASSAQAAWEQWRRIADLDLVPDEPLQNAIVEMQRCLFGHEERDAAEFGAALWSAFQENRKSARRGRTKPGQSSLPPLNPGRVTSQTAIFSGAPFEVPADVPAR